MDLLKNLTESQKKAVLHKQGPLLVIAGPGSGKTRVITHRIACLIESGVKPWNICAITFTNKASVEMQNRVASMGVPSGVNLSTFHSLCVRLLRQYAQQAGITSNFSIYDDSDQKRVIKQAIADADLSVSNFAPAKMLNAISNLKNELETAESLKTRADEYFAKSLAKIYEKYQKILTENNALDFDDLLMKVAFLLREHPEVRSELNNRFKYLLVDEYQDTNHAQYQIAKGLAIEHQNICVTGDPDQSIYRWRGADIRNIMSFEKDWPHATVVKLEENFRSCQSILTAADKLIANNKNRKVKALIATIKGGEDIRITDYEDDTAEAYGLSKNIKKLIEDGQNPSEIAVFYRVNSMSRILEEALVQNKIPYQIVRGVEFYGRKEIRDMLAYLKLLVNPADNVALQRTINTPVRGIGKTTIDKIAEYASSAGIPIFEALKKAQLKELLNASTQAKLAKFVALIESFQNMIDGPVAPLMEKVFTVTKLADTTGDDKNKSESAIDNVNELINSAGIYDQQSEKPNLTDYLQAIALYSDSDAYDASQPKVALMTLHAAKGLEFDNVFIIGLEDGILPHERSAVSQDEFEEERRLFFVGITRARKRLFISYADYRTTRGQFLRTIPSPFLVEIGYNPLSSPAAGFTEKKQDFNSSEFGYDTSSSQIESAIKPIASPQRQASQTSQPYIAGQLVSHKKFGFGRVQQFIEMGDNSIVVVNFNAGHTRSLMLKYANLDIVNKKGD
jgi:DNA helicase-2/ATP-dependent DNA helicase PcrA